MMFLPRLRAWVRSVTRRSRFERDMAAELRFHVDSYTEDLVRSGVPRDDARRQARLEFGSVEWKKDDCRATLGVRLVDELLGDLRYGFRTLRHAPAFTIVAIVTLALGIGANTAIFTLTDAVLLRMMRVREPTRLYQVRRLEPSGPSRVDGAFTTPLYEALRERQTAFSSIAAWGNTQFNLSRGGTVQQAAGLWVTGSYFDTLGIAPAAGRLLGPSDDRAGCPAVAVISYAFWQKRYAGSPAAVGSGISLNSHPFEIVGVSQNGFYGVDVGASYDVAAPVCATTMFDGARSRLTRRSWWWLSIVGRSAPDLSREQMNARLASISPQVTAAAVPLNWDEKYRRPFLETKFVTSPAAAGVSYGLRETFGAPLTLLMAVVGIVLLIACANIASLMLARGAAQAREIRVRLALGAGRARLVRQFLTHALVLSAAGALIGLLLARWGTAVLVAAISTRREQIFLDVSPDSRIAMFTTAVVIFTSLLFGVLPALRTTKVPLTGSTRGPAGTLGSHAASARTWIVAAQIALSLLLLVTAGLCLRSFGKLVHLDTGFNRDNVLLVTATLRPTLVDPKQQLSTFDEIERRLGAVPGAASVARSHVVPLSGGGWNDSVVVDEPNAPRGHDGVSLANFVSPGYFATMGTALRAGRAFTRADGPAAPRVAVVNEAFVRKFFGTIDPIGRTLRVVGVDNKPGPSILIVGVSANATYLSLREEKGATAFFPISQIPEPEGQDTFAIRTSTPPESLTKSVEAEVAGVNPGIPLEFTTLRRVVDDAMVQERLLAMLSAFFGAMALLLAMVGLYGTISYRVTLRRAEFGIRKALGAPSGAITGLVIAEVGSILLLGTAAGLILSALTTSTLRTLLFGIEPRDATTMAGAAIVLAAVALVAGYVPARRAARVEPMAALRCD